MSCEKALIEALAEVEPASGWLPQNLGRPRPLTPGQVLRKVPQRLRRSRWSRTGRSRFYGSLGLMLESGFPLSGALEHLSKQVPEGLEGEFENVRRLVLAEGRPLSRALAALPGLISLPDRAYLVSAEISGTMGTTLLCLAQREDEQASLERRLQAQLLPPLALAALCWAAVVLLALVVHQLLAATLLELAPTDPVVAWGVRLLDPKLLAGASLAAGATLAVGLLALTEASWSYYLEPIYFSFSWARAVANIRISRLLGGMLASGVTLTTALRCLRESESSPWLLRIHTQVEQQILAGSNLHNALQLTDFFPTILLSLVKSGEETGQLARGLLRYADLAEQGLQYQFNQLLVFLQVFLITLPGLLVLLVALLGFWPLVTVLEKL
ncbi:type II secretion system F family protein [bacterium]|nr:type II secretion system F family protein [bacterium]